MAISDSAHALARQPLSRRGFLRMAAAAGIATAFPPDVGHSAISPPVSRDLAGPTPSDRNALRRMYSVPPSGLTLSATVGTAEIAPGVPELAWVLNDTLPSPLLRTRRGDRFHVELQNALPEPLILHWHGLTPPELADGHPRLAVGPGGRYSYDFQVDNRAGTYWYHSHTHHRVGKHVFLGIAGMLIVDDEEEEALHLPSGAREIPIILQDRPMLHSHTILPYDYPDPVEGLLGNEPFGNGILRPLMLMDTAVYRLRVLNGANARIFRLGRSDAKPLVLIGNDGGLLETSATVDYVDLSPGERIDLLVDLRDKDVGDSIVLGSKAFHIASGLATREQSHRQGHPMDLLELRVVRRVEDPFIMPRVLSHVVLPDLGGVRRERSFVLSSTRDQGTRMMMRHLINGRSFDMHRIDERVRLGDSEIWTFANQNQFAHPVHLHGTHFTVLAREGGRDRVMPWERGLKDTVLVYPGEEVRVGVQFTAHPGLFLLHCHNLEHEDGGMMLNILVE